MTKPESTLPFEGLYWNHSPNYVTYYYGVNYDDATYVFGIGGRRKCTDLYFNNPFFADFRAPGNAYSLTFSLLRSTDGLADGSD
jgi:hypothetical protein